MRDMSPSAWSQRFGVGSRTLSSAARACEVTIDPRSAFWVIKHGLKMSAMPAWGKTHDDETIWSMVAFVNKLPSMSAQEYKEMVAKAPRDEEMEGMKNMPGMKSTHGDAEDAKNKASSSRPREANHHTHDTD